MTRRTAGAFVAVLVAAILAPAARGQSKAPIPDRPEKLTFPPLQWEPPDPAKFRVVLKSGPVAYVVPDRELPLVSITVLVRTGGYVVPPGKEGLEDLAGLLLARGGTKSKGADELEERLAYLAAQLNSAIGDTQGTVSLNLLSKDLDEGLAILREVLTAPRFQEDKLALQKQRMLQAMRRRNDDSAGLEQRERAILAYGESFWANRFPTEASVQGITRADLEDFHREWFHPSGFVVAASGDFDRAAMIARLETLFAGWPFAGETAPPVPGGGTFAKAGVYLLDKDVNQGRVSVMLPGFQRDDPDAFAILVMNDILGGGGFTSRITNRVRSDEGLAYSAGSQFPGGVYFPGTFRAAFQSKSRSVAYATAVVVEEIRAMAAKPVSAEELDTARKQFTERFPRTFGTKAQTAAVFAEDELTGRFAKNPDYWKTYRAKIAAVTAADVQRVARKYLVPERLVIAVVGKKSDILAGDLKHDVSLPALAGGSLVDLPERDPMTMKAVLR